ncbi:hypothetical protein HY991_04030 [Candidatus Micrarchaeota archaeon]|nr:hypothetical protein [Candidatus Micrarchaeota archaeon]
MKFNYWVMGLLLAAVLLSAYSHSLVFKEFMMPVYGNVGIHGAFIRELVEKGNYPLVDKYSYGGGIPNIYVPLYRMAVAEMVLLTGISIDFASRLVVLLISLLLPIAFFILARTLFKKQERFALIAGLAAAFFVSLSPELLIYTVRPLPQAMGMLLIPVILFLVLKQLYFPVALFTFLLTMVHQESAFFLVLCCFAFGFFLLVKMFLSSLEKEEQRMLRATFLCWFVGTASYFVWNAAMTGHFNVFGTAQFTYHEGNSVSIGKIYSSIGTLSFAFSVIGLVTLFTGFALRLPEKIKKFFAVETLPTVFLFSLLVVGIAAIKNDVLGINVFMDRFIVYLNEPLVLLAAFGFSKVITWLGFGELDS